MGIRKVSLGIAAAALLGVSPAMAATPVTPSVAQLAPAGYSMGAGVRQGAATAHGKSSLAGGGLVIAVLAAAAVAGGVVAATSKGHHHHSVSP